MRTERNTEKEVGQDPEIHILGKSHNLQVDGMRQEEKMINFTEEGILTGRTNTDLLGDMTNKTEVVPDLGLGHLESQLVNYVLDMVMKQNTVNSMQGRILQKDHVLGVI